MMAWIGGMPLAGFQFSFIGEGKGLPAVAMFLAGAIILIGSIYLLVASNYGFRTGLHIIGVGLFGWMIILSLMWVAGAPGTVPGTGPRGREPAWVPFLPDSEQAAEFRDAIDGFPSGDGWQGMGASFPGGIESSGEFSNVNATVRDALARRAAFQGEEATDPADWRFREPGSQPIGDDPPPVAEIGFYQEDTPLIFGARIPATEEHPAVTVFAFRDKGLVFAPAAIFLGVSVVMFFVHVAALGRIEKRQKRREREMAGGPSQQPVTV